MDYNEFKEQVRNASDIVDVIGKYVDLKQSGANYKGLCPFHNEKTPSFHIMPDNQFFYCFGCHKGGDVFSFLCEYNNLEFPEAVEELATEAGIEIPKKFDAGDGNSPAKGLRTKLFDIYKDAAQIYYAELFKESGKKALDYFLERGISRNTITAFGLGYAPGGEFLYNELRSRGYNDEELKESGLISYKTGRPLDFFFDRAMYPIMNKNSRVISFGARVIGGENPKNKYINTRETLIYKKKEVLYGINRAVRAKTDRVILCEGYMDVISSNQAGFPEAVASCGTAFTPEQADLIKRIAKKVYLIFDTDSPGVGAMLTSIPILRNAGLFVNIASMLPYKDPDLLIKNEGAESFERRLANAENAFFFEVDKLSEQFNLDDPSERAGFENELAERIAAFSNKFEREQFIRTISEKYNTDPDLLKAEVSRIGMQNEANGDHAGAYRVRDHTHHTNQGKVNYEAIDDEKNVLCGIVSSPEYFDVIKRYIGPEDFSEGIMKNIAEVVYKGMENGRITVADIIGSFADEEASDVSKIFVNKIYGLSDEAEKKKFISDSVLSIRKRKINRQIALCSPDDADIFQRLSAERKELDNTASIFDSEGGL